MYPESIISESKLLSSKADEPKLNIVDIAVSNCVPDATNPHDTCSPGRMLIVSKLPIVFWMFTHSDPSLKGASFDITLQIRDFSSNKVLFETYSTTEVVFPDQQDVLFYDKQIPSAIAALPPGRYKLYGMVLTADGVNFAEKTVIITTRASALLRPRVLIDLNADCRTISAGPDNGFLACASNYFNHPPTNNTNLQVVTNLLACIGTGKKTTMVIGHGNEGFIKSGNGNSGGSDDQFIGNFNRAKWLPYFRNLRDKCLNMKLLGCDVGAGDAGADLLFYVATAINAVVMAPTYLVWCGGNGVYLDPKAQWQTAYPNIRPTPIPKPTLLLTSMFESMKLHRDEGEKRVPVAAVQGISLIRHNIRGDEFVVHLTREDAQEILQLVDFENPFTPGAIPAAVITGELQIELGETEPGASRLRFRIFNNELLEDVFHEGTFYFATSAFGQFMAQL